MIGLSNGENNNSGAGTAVRVSCEDIADALARDEEFAHRLMLRVMEWNGGAEQRRGYVHRADGSAREWLREGRPNALVGASQPMDAVPSRPALIASAPRRDELASWRNGRAQSLLHLASVRGHAPIAGTLVHDCGAAVHARDREGGTPLHFACAAGHTAVVILLVNAGADPLRRDAKWGRSCVEECAAFNRVALAGWLTRELERRRRVNAASKLTRGWRRQKK